MKHYSLEIKVNPFCTYEILEQWRVVLDEVKRNDPTAYCNMDAYGLFIDSKIDTTIELAIDLVDQAKLRYDELEYVA